MMSPLLCILMAFVTLYDQERSPELQDGKTANIQGVVTNSITGGPLNHVHVTLENYSAQPVKKYGATSNSEGRFSVTGVVPGTYSIRAERRGYVLPTSKENSAGNITINLRSGEERNNLELRMTPGGVISGRILDENGMPVGNVLVQAIRGQITASAETNDIGEFRISGLRSGGYLIRASSLDNIFLPREVRTDGTKETQYGHTYYPGSLTLDGASMVRVNAGTEVDGINIPLSRIKIVRVSGFVSGLPNSPQGVGVSLLAGHSAQSVPLGRDFRFTIWRLTPGIYGLHARYQGISGQPLESAITNIEVSEADIDNVELRLVKPFNVQGRVEGEPLTLAQHSDQARLQLSLGPENADCTIKEDGTFMLGSVEPGLYRPRLSGLPSDLYLKSISIGSEELSRPVLDLRAGTPPAAIVLQLGRGTAEISGTIRDQKGRPLGGMVALLTDDGYPSVNATFSSNPDGSYSIRGISPGPYKLFAFELSDYGVTESDEGVALYRTVTHKIDLRENDKITQDLTLLSFTE